MGRVFYIDRQISGVHAANAMRAAVFLILFISLMVPASQAKFSDLKQAKFTQVVNDVKVLAMPAKTQQPARVEEVFKAPDLVKTGSGSRAELVADDNTITRVGANTIFSFDAASRTLNLQEGSVLFHSPKGKGGGTIRTTAASASVLGTTIIVSATPDGGFKILVLEGKAKIKLPNGKTVTLKAGEMTFVLPGSEAFGPVITFNLEDLIQNSLLVKGFVMPLPSMGQINLQVQRQNRDIQRGFATDTGLLVGNQATETTIQVVDANIQQHRFRRSFIEQFFTPPDDNNNIPPVDPPVDPPLFDVIINDFIPDDGRVIHVEPNQAHIISGNNVLVDATLVDLSPYAHAPVFDIAASGLMQFKDNANRRTEFLGDIPRQDTINVDIGSGIQFLGLFADTFIFPEVFSVAFNGPLFLLQSSGDQKLTSSAIKQGLVFENFIGGLHFNAAKNLVVDGNVSFIGDRVLITAENLRMNGGYLGSGSFIDLRAESTLVLNGTGFGGVSSGFINMSAHTISLENITFPSGNSVFLQSQNGMLAPNPNTGAAVQPGYVNFIRNVFYGDTATPAENALNEGIFISPRSPNEVITTTSSESVSSFQVIEIYPGSINLNADQFIPVGSISPTP